MRFWGGSSVVISHDKVDRPLQPRIWKKWEKAEALAQLGVDNDSQKTHIDRGNLHDRPWGCPRTVTQLASTAQNPTEVPGAGAATQQCIPDHVTALVRPALCEFMGH